jgi:hypothetical protein
VQGFLRESSFVEQVGNPFQQGFAFFLVGDGEFFDGLVHSAPNTPASKETKKDIAA